VTVRVHHILGKMLRRVPLDVLVAALIVATPVSAQRMGYAYTVHVTGEQVAHGSASAPGGAMPNYVGHATALGNRGRIDVVDGGADGLFAKGDYLLFDSVNVVVVHPSKREFIRISRDSAPGGADQLEALGAKVALTDEKVTLDSLGASDTVSGVPTRHYRLTVAFNMGVDGGVIQQRLATESVTDYWAAVIPDLRANALLRVNALQVGAGGLFRELSARVDSVARRMGQAVALRSRTTTRVMLAPGAVIETRQTMDVSDLRRTTVDESLLKLPSDYRER
jgi:hypothetical protein